MTNRKQENTAPRQEKILPMSKQKNSHTSITERKPAEEKLRLEKAKLDQLFDIVPEAIIMSENDGRIIRANQEFLRLFRYSEEEVIGKNIDELVLPGGNFINAKSVTKSTASGKSMVLETKLKKKDGTLFNVSVLVSPVVIDGKQIALYSIYTDISDRKNREEELERKTSDLRERVKELNCLYAISNLKSAPNILLEEILKKTTELIPSGFKYPETACARIVYKDKSFHSKNFRKTGWQLAADIRVNGQKIGSVEVCYLKKKSSLNEDLFLKEERNLIEAIADSLALTIQRKSAEKALKLNEERFKALFDNVPTGVYRTTPDGKIIDANPALVKMLGYKSFQELAKINLKKEGYTQGYRREDFIKNIEKNGEVRGYESRWQKRDGTEILIRENAKLFRDKEGKNVYYQGSVEDITQQKRAEDEIKQNAAFVSENPSPVLQTKMDGHITFANRPAKEIFKNKTRSSSLYTLLPDLKKSRIASLEYNTSYQMEQKIGEKDFLFSIIKDKATASLFVYGTDISVLKETETELKDSEERLRLLFEFAPDAYYINDLKGTFIDGNRAAERLTGYKRDELIGKVF